MKETLYNQADLQMSASKHMKYAEYMEETSAPVI